MRRAVSLLTRVHALAVLCLTASAAAASDAAPLPAPTGADLALLWGLPFAGLLLSIALVPLASAPFWHDHFGKVTAGWVLALLAPFTFVFGAMETVHQVAHAMLLEYLPFVAILFALFTIAGGICVRGAIVGTPALNTGILALGAALASIMGTTGAAMLLIRPLLTANEHRRHKVHAVVFFIILVGNVGGALSPLGDPPLFIGFLKGVDFFWTTRELGASDCGARRRPARAFLAVRRLALSQGTTRLRTDGGRTGLRDRGLDQFPADRGRHRCRVAVGAMGFRHRLRRARRAPRAAERAARRHALRPGPAVAAADAQGSARAQRLPLGADRRSGEDLRRRSSSRSSR